MCNPQAPPRGSGAHSGYSPYRLHVELTKGPLPLSLLPQAQSKGGRRRGRRGRGYRGRVTMVTDCRVPLPPEQMVVVVVVVGGANRG